jgi:hypothetical protein
MPIVHAETETLRPREKLAKEIASLASIKAELSRIEAGLHFAKNEISSARTAIKKAEKELEAVKADSASIFISKAMKGAEGGGPRRLRLLSSPARPPGCFCLIIRATQMERDPDRLQLFHG